MKNTPALSAAAIALLFGGLTAPPAEAAFVVDLTQVADKSQPSGFDVVANGKGTLDTTDLTSAGTPGILTAGIQPDIGFIAVASGIATGFAGISGPSTFGPGGNFTQPTNSSGDAVTISISFDLGVPDGYTSGTFLSDTSTYEGATFASLGVTPGTYTWTWGSGAHADSFALQVGVPEPSTWALMLVGFGLLGGASYWRRRSLAIAA
jgi:hypothetical protein